MPVSLARLANQFHELANVVGLTDRVQRESTDKSLFPVAIIDCGMDLAHPDLVQKIAFDLDKGRLVGAGFDFMGNDRWASANLVNPTLFAVGADLNADDKLVNVNPEPLEYLADLNQKFMTDLVARIAADPVLNKSLFQKLTARSMTIIGAANYVQQGSYSLEDYKNAEKEDTLLDVDTRARMANEHEYAQKILKDTQSAVLVDYLDLPWTLDAKSGVPIAGFTDTTANVGQFTALKHSDAFHALVVQAFNEFDQKTGIAKRLANYKRLMAQKADLIGPLQGEEYNELSTALAMKLNGIESLDPMKSFAKTLELAILDEPKNQGKVAGQDLILDTKTYNNELDSILGRFEEMVQALEKSGSRSASVANDIARAREAMGPMRELIQWYRNERDLNSTLGANPREGTPQYSLYRRYLVRNSIPYLSSESNGAAHGTHTAGIVAAQDSNIRIVPVRVITQSMVTNQLDNEKAKAKFKEDFTSWLKSPLVFRALAEAMVDLDDSNYTDASPENRERVAQHLTQSLSQKIDLEFEKEPLDFQFLNEVSSAIRFVGERKIKIANISLGTSFSAVPTSLTNLSRQAKLENLFDFLKFEYFKFEIGSNVRRYAPQTLFVVAAGNDGKWVDGRSRSALPMDISSPFLAPFEDAKRGEVAPNNGLSNILAVGSVDPNGKLSSFTNILLGSKTPYVLAHGESILSPVKTTDLESVTQLLDAKIPFFLQPTFGADSMNVLEAFYQSKAPKTDSPLSASMAMREVQRHYEASQDVLKSLAAATQLHLFLKYPNHRARMTGTSMATPAVTGMMSHLIIEKAKRLGISPQEIYDRPEFTPSALVEDMFKITQPLGGTNGRGIAMSALMSDLKNEPAQGAVDLEKALDQAVTEGLKYPCLRTKSTMKDPFCEGTPSDTE